MSYDDVEIEDMEWNEELQAYTYPCPCGDLFQITKEDLKLGEEIARCPSCSLYITVIYNLEDFLADSDQNRRNKGLQPSKQQPLTVAWISGPAFTISYPQSCLVELNDMWCFYTTIIVCSFLMNLMLHLVYWIAYSRSISECYYQSMCNCVERQKEKH